MRRLERWTRPRVPTQILFGLAIFLVGLSLINFNGTRPSFTETAQASSSYDWPTLAHDMARTGYTAVGPVGPYTKQWYRDFWSESGEEVADGYEPVAVHDSVHNLDLTYIGTATGSLYALNLANGATFWRYPAPGQFIGGILSSPTVFNGIVYVASLDGNVYALDGTNVSNGVPALLWKFSTGRQGGFWSTPVVTPNGVYVAGRDGYFYALDPNTGAKLWEYNVGAPIEMSPAYDSGSNVLYFGAEDMHAYALNASNGSLVWQSPQLAGQTFRGSYPVIAGANGLVIFRTAPNDDPHNVLGEGEEVLAHAAGCLAYPAHPSYSRTDIPCFNWKATATSPISYTVETQAVISYLSGAGYGNIPGRPQYESFFALSESTGQKAFTAPILWTSGDANPGEPPVVDGSGRIWVDYRSYYSDYDEPNWYIMDAFGQLNPSTDTITIRNPNPNPTTYTCDQYSCANPFVTNTWMIGDETTSFSVAGNHIYTGGAAYGSVNLDTGDLQSVVGLRDRLASSLTSNVPNPTTSTTFPRRSLPYGQTPPAVFEPSPPTIFGNTIIVHNNSIVAAMVGQLTGSSPVTPQPTSTPMPNQSFTPTSVSPVAIPNQTPLQQYIWNVPTAMNVDQSASADLISQLNQLVSATLSTGRLAPWIFLPGKTDIDGSFLNPAQTEYFLALAYPYVSASLQSQIVQFVHNDQATTNPISSYYGYTWNDGLTYNNGQVIADLSRLRVPFAPGPYDYCQIQGCEGMNGYLNFLAIPTSFDRLYDLWFYAYRTGDWSWLENNWFNIQQNYGVQQTINNLTTAIANGTDSSGRSLDDDLLGLPTDPTNLSLRTASDSANRRLSALIGYTRIAYHMYQKNNDSADLAAVNWGTNAATLALQARLRYVNNFRPSDGNGTDPNTSTWTVPVEDQSGGLFLQRFGQTTNVPQFRDLTPEISQFLADNAFPDLNRDVAFVNTVFPTRYLQRGTNNSDSEVMFGHPANTQGIFLANAEVTGLPGPQLRQYLDVPAVQREDFYYLERLVRTIDAYGQLGIADSRYPNQAPTLAGYSVSLQVQK